jgi:hypothetical protein
MKSVAQRVMMIVCFSVKPAKFVTAVDDERIRKEITTALGVLTNAKPPVIELESIELGTDAAGTAYRRIKYKDLLAGTGVDQTVQLT